MKNELRKCKLCAKLVAKNLTEEQKKHRVDVYRDWLEAIESENILECVITCDESWLFEYDPETKRKSMQWVGEVEAKPNKARISKSPVKSMLVAFFDKEGLIHKEFLLENTTMNAELYLNIVQHVREQICRVRPEFWANNSWLFYQDNTPVHFAFKICDFFAQNQVNVLDHPYIHPISLHATFFIL